MIIATKNRERIIRALVWVILGLFLFAGTALASETIGTIDSDNKYVWGENIGWINFGTSGGAVTITDSAITGHAWNEQYGWIKLDPTNGGVTNDGEGNLSGSAWGTNLGWVDFEDVVINSNGQFTGQATGTVSGIINFDCTNCNVQTDWRPQSARSTATASGGNTTIIEGGTPDQFGAPLPGFYSVTINDNDSETNSRQVTLKLRGNASTTYVWIAEEQDLTPSFRVGYNTAADETVVTFALSPGAGLKTVYAKFCQPQGQCSPTVFDDIFYDPTPTPVEVVEETVEVIEDVVSTILPGQLPSLKPIVDLLSGSQLITELGKIVANWINQPVEETIPLVELLPKEAPIAFREKWVLLPEPEINRFVFAPLPAEFIALKAQFPTLDQTFNEVGVERFSDVDKLSAVQLKLPTLGRVASLPTSTDLDTADYELPAGVPLANLSAELKDKIPAEFVFARSTDELIDFDTVLTLSRDGQPINTITTLSGQSFQLAIKPKKPVSHIRGFLLLTDQQEFRTTPSQDTDGLLGKLLGIDTVWAHGIGHEDEPALHKESKFVLAQFDYRDSDQDGIYTARITSPIPSGKYEIVTEIDYVDQTSETNKEIRLINLVDPEGYIFEKFGNKEIRIPGAIVSIYWLDPKDTKYKLWPAGRYQQENPQVTGVKGSYAFLVPPGLYYLEVEAPGYIGHSTKPFQVKQGSGVHINIELKSKTWWWKVLDWKTLLLVVISLLLVYNFYKDKKRNQAKNDE